MSPTSTPPSDDENRQQWRDVYDESLVGLRNFLRQRLGQQADVDDCLQAVFVKVIGAKNEIPMGARKAWLFRVAANEAAMMWRRKSVTHRVLEKQATVTQDVDTDNSVDQLIQDETAQQARRIINSLPESTQQIIRLRIDEDLTFQEIADRLDIPLGTALTRMRRALEKIKSEIEKNRP
ncbi:MAG: sigma-70 family RNA polymerase sigma factor [Pirellulaceae bacterium]